MSKQATTIDPVLLPEDDLIPLALVAVETDESIERLALRFGDAVVLDDVGLRSVSASVAREFFTERAEWEARQAEEHRRRTEELAQKYRPLLVGAPAREGMSPAESMVAADPNYQTPQDEFSGRERPTFLEDMLAQGQRDLAEKQAKAKQRAVDQLKKDLQ